MNRAVKGPASRRLPSSTAILAPLGRLGGPSTHFTSAGVERAWLFECPVVWAVASVPPATSPASITIRAALRMLLLLSACSGLLDHVQVSQHVDVDVAVDDRLPRLVLLDAADVRLGGPVADDPLHRDVADVALEDLLGLRVVLEPLLLVAGVAAGIQLLVEGLVGPRLALAGGPLAVEGVEVLVVRIGEVHEPADPHELQVLLPQPLPEHALLQDLQLGLHV